MPRRFALLLLLAGLSACADASTWSLSAMAQGHEVLVSLWATEGHPRGPARLSFDGVPFDAVDRGGRRLTLVVGPSAFGPQWQSPRPSYKVVAPPGAGAAGVSVIGAPGTAGVAEFEHLLSSYRFELEAPARSFLPGEEVRLHAVPDFPAMAELNLYFRERGAPHETLQLWASSRPGPKGAPLAWTPGGPLRFVVPADAKEGPGELLVNGFVRVVTRRCDGWARCDATTLVSVFVPIDIGPPALAR